MEKEYDYCPWQIRDKNTPELAANIEKLKADGTLTGCGKDCFISKYANICFSKIKLGDGCVIAADAYIRHADITFGYNCSVNPYVYMQGKITVGNNCRIAPKATICAYNHTFSDINKPIDAQPGEIKEIVLGDDVWVGANATVVAGVKIGSHSVIAAGAVVTKNVPDYTVVGGNPARPIKNRLVTYYKDKLAEFCKTVENDIEAIVDSHFINGEYVDLPTQLPVRAWCDAVELCAMFGKEHFGYDRKTMAEKIESFTSGELDYSVLTIGYALENLGTHISKPHGLMTGLKGADLEKWLAERVWDKNPWAAGDDIDMLGTAWYQNKKYFGIEPDTDTLFKWLNENVNEKYGMWTKRDDILLTVNGYYRLTRGSFAQFNEPVPMPEKAIDTVLIRAAETDDSNCNACNVLDIIHPLWLCKKQTDHRAGEGREFAAKWIDKILENYHPGRGFSFDLTNPEGNSAPSLMGTEMWLSIIYIMCDYLGIADLVTYSPKGVHRLKTDI